jgi:transcriptional regulator with XRE-family HTH domain
MAAPRVCSACRTTRLSRFNTENVCAPCTRAARDLNSVAPTWLWDSQPIRKALARLDVGAAMAIFRVAAGLSQQALADIMGWSQSQVSLIEKAKRDTLFDLRELVRFADMVEMPRAALAPVLAGEPDATFDVDGLDERADGAEEDVDRRSFGGFAAGAAAAFVLPDVAVPPRVTAAHVRYLRACVDSLWRRDQAVGGAAILKQALRHWRRARRMLDESDYSEDVGRDLLGTASSLGVCAGWLAFDAGNLSLARRMYSEALPLAGSANDPVLTVHVLEKLSMLASYVARTSHKVGPAYEAMRLARQAGDAGRFETQPRLSALIAVRDANAASLLGDTAGFRSVITSARRELDRALGADDPEWMLFVDDAEIAGQEAMGRLNLGEVGRGEELYRSVLDGELSPRSRACKQALLAAALARCGDTDGAVREGTIVLPALEGGLTSIRTLNELRPVRFAAEKIKAGEFCVRFDAAERALTAV